MATSKYRLLAVACAGFKFQNTLQPTKFWNLMGEEDIDPTAQVRNPVLRNEMTETEVKVGAAWSLLGWMKNRRSKNCRSG